MTYGYSCPLVSEACLCCLLGGAFFVHHLQNNNLQLVLRSSLAYSWCSKTSYLSRSPLKWHKSTIQKAYLQNQLIHQNQTHLKQKICLQIIHVPHHKLTITFPRESLPSANSKWQLDTNLGKNKKAIIFVLESTPTLREEWMTHLPPPTIHTHTHTHTHKTNAHTH